MDKKDLLAVSPEVAGRPDFGGEYSAGSVATEPPPITSDRLYNVDLAPTKQKGRTWSAYSIFTLWANDVHSLGNYSFAIGLFALGLGAWQVLTALGVGALLLFFLLCLSGFMGQKTGVPYPVMSRISFGVHGAHLPAGVRGIVAIAWFGIQTYLASVVLRVLLIALWPGLESLDSNSFLGLSTLGWLSFLALWLVQVVIICYGMEMIRKYEAFAGPIILVTMLALAIWMLLRVDFAIAWSTDTPLTGGQMWLHILGGGSLWVSIYGTFVLNFCDFTRSAKSRGSIVRGNFWGIPVNMLLFGLIVVSLAGAQFKIDGRVITSPADIVETIPSTLFLVLASLALLILTVAVNLMANFVAPTFALTNMFPRKLNFARAAIVSAVIGLLILPWNLYNSPVVIVYFLGGLGALLGPLFGIIMVDYWIIRRSKVNVPQLYIDAQEGEYYYRKGVNPRAIAAFIPAALVSMAVALLPGFSAASEFAWFIGAGLGALCYLVAAKKSLEYTDQHGESIAVAATH
ncbi:NCS1 family nucleobase:cation symporter-1 [Kocuria sp. cx-455]|uniref:NCS1 family nucleobase:cation symporter-1 n=1 Tax=Kocuria sp. cx-455 TaxID=2771377 RepID=UPI001683F08F|nr:NCS1 family nucleobase:cation symporter-1 [Kocuria sp. cx-455]MBD2766018.1 NCS1 family nucleobase:cation symporter-1 [Kocuria sp. cx-455]